MAQNALEKMNPNQQAAVAKLQRMISDCNRALDEAAQSGIDVEIGSTDITVLGEPATIRRITASVRWPNFQIA